MTTTTPAPGMTTPLPGAGTNWRSQGRCLDEDPDLFFMETDAGRQAALSICAGCPVRERCLTGALAEEGGRNINERHGIRGGQTPTGRFKIYSRTAKPRKADEPPSPKPTPREPAKCGTRGGYQRHRRNGEQACAPCRHANSAADRRLRETGSTVAA